MFLSLSTWIGRNIFWSFGFIPALNGRNPGFGWKWSLPIYCFLITAFLKICAEKNRNWFQIVFYTFFHWKVWFFLGYTFEILKDGDVFDQLFTKKKLVRLESRCKGPLKKFSILLCPSWLLNEVFQKKIWEDPRKLNNDSIKRKFLFTVYSSLGLKLKWPLAGMKLIDSLGPFFKRFMYRKTLIQINYFFRILLTMSSMDTECLS